MKIFLSAKLEKEARGESLKKRKAKAEGWRRRKVLKPEVEGAGSHEESVVLNGETEVTRGSLTQVLADLMAGQGLGAGKQFRDEGSGVPQDLSISPSENLPSEKLGVAETWQEDPIDLSSQESEAEDEGTLEIEIEEIIKEKNALWAQYFKPH